MSSDPAAGAPAATAPVGARAVAVGRGRIPFEILTAVVVVGAVAAGRFVEAALVGLVVGLGAWLGQRLRVSGGDDRRERAAIAARALSAFTDWFTPLTIALAAAVLLRNADVALALTLLLIASPQALLALPRSSPLSLRALAATMAAALLVATLAGFIGLVTVALLQQASMLAARFAPRLASARAQRPT